MTIAEDLLLLCTRIAAVPHHLPIAAGAETGAMLPRPLPTDRLLRAMICLMTPETCAAGMRRRMIVAAMTVAPLPRLPQDMGLLEAGTMALHPRTVEEDTKHLVMCRQVWGTM